jgi:hypothetical protein
MGRQELNIFLNSLESTKNSLISQKRDETAKEAVAAEKKTREEADRARDKANKIKSDPEMYK